MKLLAAAAIICGLAGELVAQTPFPDPQPGTDSTPTFRSGVNLVSVPVVARDASGRAVGTLQKEDFQLYDKGKPQLIARFSVERTDARAAFQQAAGGSNPPGTAAAANFVGWLFDDEHLEFEDLSRARSAARQKISAMEPGTRFGIFTTSGRVTADFTNDRSLLDETLLRIKPAAMQPENPLSCDRIPFYLADQAANSDDEAALRAIAKLTKGCSGQVKAQLSGGIALSAAIRAAAAGDRTTSLSLEALRAIVQRLSLLPGSRTIVLISPGFYLATHHRLDESDLLDRAIQADVVISSLDARGLFTYSGGSALRSQVDAADAEVMAELADATGGLFVHNSNDLAGGLTKLVTQPEFVYTLEFSPQNLKNDTTFHNLKVTVDKKGYELQARHGYFIRQQAANSAETAKEEIDRALFARGESNGLPIELNTQFFRTGEASRRLSILTRVDVRGLHYQKVDGRNLNTLIITGGLFDRNGKYVTGHQKTVELKLKDETLVTPPEGGVTFKSDLDVAPGSYLLRVVVRDSEDQGMSTRNIDIEIP